MMTRLPTFRMTLITLLACGLGAGNLVSAWHLGEAATLARAHTLVERLCECGSQSGEDGGSGGLPAPEGESAPARSHSTDEEAEVFSAVPILKQKLAGRPRSASRPPIQSDIGRDAACSAPLTLVALQVRLDR